MSTPPEIREAGPADAPEIARLSGEFGYPAATADIESRLMALAALDSHLVSVAVEPGGSLLGWVAVEHRTILESGERAEIVGLVVAASARRSGTGAALVAAAERWARDRGLSEIVVRSNTARTASHSFYPDIGFVRSKTQHVYAKSL